MPSLCDKVSGFTNYFFAFKEIIESIVLHVREDSWVFYPLNHFMSIFDVSSISSDLRMEDVVKDMFSHEFVREDS